MHINNSQQNLDRVISNIVMTGDTLYGIKLCSKQMVRMNINTGQAEYICGIKGKEYLNNNRAPLMKLCGEKIYCLPPSCEMMFAYLIKDNKYLQISEMKGQDFCYSPYLLMESYANQLYVFFGNEMGICRFSNSLEKVECSEYDNIDKIEMKSFRVGNKIYLIEYIKGFVWAFDLEKEKLELVNNAPTIIGAEGVVYADGIVYIVYNDNSIMIWNMITGKYDRIQPSYTVKSLPCSSFSYLLPAGNKMYLLPALADDIIVTDGSSMFEVYNDYPSDYCYIRNQDWLRKGSKFFLMCETESSYVFPMRAVNYMLVISKISGTIRWIKPIFSDDANIYESAMELGGIIYENDLSLKSFIKLC